MERGHTRRNPGRVASSPRGLSNPTHTRSGNAIGIQVHDPSGVWQDLDGRITDHEGLSPLGAPVSASAKVDANQLLVSRGFYRFFGDNAQTVDAYALGSVR